MAQLIIQLLQVVSILLIIRALLSWFRIGVDSPVYPVARVIHQLTEPILAPVRRLLPAMGGFDLSVIAVIILIRFALIPMVDAAF